MNALNDRIDLSPAVEEGEPNLIICNHVEECLWPWCYHRTPHEECLEEGDCVPTKCHHAGRTVNCINHES